MVQAGASKVRARNPGHFQSIFLRPFEQLAAGVLASEVGQNFNLHFLFLEAKYVGNHVRGIIERFEGGSCVADKTRNVINSLARHLADHTPITFDYDSKFSYGYPTQVLTNQVEILNFFDAIQSLHYGRPEKYLAVLQSIAQNSSNSLARASER